jgi:hypothetical protein
MAASCTQAESRTRYQKTRLPVVHVRVATRTDPIMREIARPRGAEKERSSKPVRSANMRGADPNPSNAKRNNPTEDATWFFARSPARPTTKSSKEVVPRSS